MLQHQGRETPLQDEANATASNLIFRSLREKIITLQMAPGSTMSEQETAAAMGVSRTPVREAFIRLDREKMIIISPQRRTTVSKIDLQRMAQEQFVREALESAALRQFIGSATLEQLAKMENSIHQMEAAEANQDAPQIRRWDDSFHQCIYEATGNNLALQIVRHDCFEYLRIRSLSAYDAQVQEMNRHQHEELLTYIREKREDDAVGILHKHLSRVFTEIEDMKVKWPDYFL